MLVKKLASYLFKTRYMHVHHVPHAEHMESSKKYYGKAGSTVVTKLSFIYLVHGSASEVDCSGADVQVVSCHCYLVVFHLFVE